jgi:hypothetical protein
LKKQIAESFDWIIDEIKKVASKAIRELYELGKKDD